jgi:hypothetical protein
MVDLNKIVDISEAKMNRLEARTMHIGILKAMEETTTLDMSCPLPFSSDTCLAIEELNPKSETNTTRDVRSVTPAMTPISSCVMILAIKANPETAINVERMLLRVR